MQVSYCILSFNRKLPLTNLLTQLKQTRIPDSEIIVVDNGSTDGTRDAIRPFSDSCTKFVCQATNTGVSKGWNTLFKQSQGDLVFILNDDYEIVKAGWEQLYLDTMQKTMGIMSFPRSIGPIGSELYTNYILENGCKYTHNFRLFGIPRKIYNHVGGFDESFFYGYEDTDFNQAAIKLGYPLLEMNLAAVHLGHLRNQNRPKDSYDLAKEQIHSTNLLKNNQHFYKKWPSGL